jgi:RNA-directed DNA polymerase
MFREQFLCSDDVSAFLADLCTVNTDGGHGRADGHVPTGSPLSQMLAYYTHKKLFDRLQEHALSRSIKMTCYVDDLVFSGEKIVVADREAICSLIRKAGLKPNTKKTRLYRPNQAKKVTGVILLDGKEKVPNSLRRDIDNQFRLLNCGDNEVSYIKNLQKLVGQLRAAGQIEPYFSNLGSALQPILSAAQRSEALEKRGAA